MSLACQPCLSLVSNAQQMAKISKTQKMMITKNIKSKQVAYGLCTFPASVEEAAAFVPQPQHRLIAAVQPENPAKA